MIKIYFPANNLGCLGIGIGDWFYADTYTYDNRRGFFVRIGCRRYWISVDRWLATGRIKRTTN